jgi:hypothetical protein
MTQFLSNTTSSYFHHQNVGKLHHQVLRMHLRKNFTTTGQALEPIFIFDQMTYFLSDCKLVEDRRNQYNKFLLSLAKCWQITSPSLENALEKFLIGFCFNLWTNATLGHRFWSIETILVRLQTCSSPEEPIQPVPTTTSEEMLTSYNSESWEHTWERFSQQQGGR